MSGQPIPTNTKEKEAMDGQRISTHTKKEVMNNCQRMSTHPMNEDVMNGQPIPDDTTQVRMTMTPFTSVKQGDKSIVDAYILAVALGFMGAHHFYLRRPWFGITYLFTFGLFGVGYIVDLFRIPCLVKDTNRKIDDPTKENEKGLVDAYLLWFPCGFLGFHLFYLKKPWQGTLYLLTFGCLGIGWLVDLFRIPYLVKSANESSPTFTPKKTWLSYILGISPFGWLGVHHYYLERPLYGLTYTCTFGLLGVGYIVDWCRMPILVKRANRIGNKLEDPDTKYVDDIYVLWFPFGLIGFHHFYLRRIAWGFLYIFTFGLFGIGWLIDGFRLSCLVKDYNKAAKEKKNLLSAEPKSLTYEGRGTITITTIPNGNQMTSPEEPVPQYSYQNPGFYPQLYPQYPQQGQGQQGYSQYPQQAFQGQDQGQTQAGGPGPVPPTYDETMKAEKPPSGVY